jgi:hypothetical protein
MNNYHILRAVVLSLIVIALTLTIDFPVSYALVLILFFGIRAFNITAIIENKIKEVYPDFISHHKWVQRAIPFIIYITLLISLKFLLVDMFMVQILHIPVRAQLDEFVASYST